MPVWLFFKGTEIAQFETLSQIVVMTVRKTKCRFCDSSRNAAIKAESFDFMFTISYRRDYYYFFFNRVKQNEVFPVKGSRKSKFLFLLIFPSGFKFCLCDYYFFFGSLGAPLIFNLFNHS